MIGWQIGSVVSGNTQSCSVSMKQLRCINHDDCRFNAIRPDDQLRRSTSLTDSCTTAVASFDSFLLSTELLCVINTGINTRNSFQLALLVYRCLHGSALGYQASDLQRVSDLNARWQLHSSSTSVIVAPHTLRATVGDRAFPAAAASVQNSLVESVRASPSLTVFRLDWRPSFLLGPIAVLTRAMNFSLTTKGAFHQRRSNLGSAEPGSTLIVDLNQVQVMMRSTNVKLRSADVVQLNHDGYTSWTLIGLIWSRSVTSHILFTLVSAQERRPVANVFNWLSTMRNVFLALILWLFHHRGGEIWGWSDSTVNHSLLLKVNKIKISYHAQYNTRSIRAVVMH